MVSTTVLRTAVDTPLRYRKELKKYLIAFLPVFILSALVILSDGLSVWWMNFDMLLVAIAVPAGLLSLASFIKNKNPSSLLLSLGLLLSSLPGFGRNFLGLTVGKENHITGSIELTSFFYVERASFLIVWLLISLSVVLQYSGKKLKL